MKRSPMKPGPSLPSVAGALVALLATLALAGCSLFSRPASDEAQYYLEATSPPRAAKVGGGGGGGEILPEISLRRASASAPFDGLAFVYAQADGTWRTDPYAGWIATPSAMVTNALSDHLGSCGRFGMVTTQGTLRSDRPELSVVLERLYGDFRGDSPEDSSGGGSGRAVVRIRWYLVAVDATSSRDSVLGSGVAEAEAPIAARDSGAVAQAMSEALGAAFGQIVEGVAAAAPKKGG